MSSRLHRLQRWMYRGGRPGGVARLMTSVAAWQSAAGLLRWRDAALQVRGRTSGKTIAVPVVIADHDGERYLVSMLGEDANWVHNVKHAGGRAVLNGVAPSRCPSSRCRRPSVPRS